MRPDSEIAVSVANLLKWHVAVEHDKIKIKVEKGIVTLEGEVAWDWQRQDIEAMVRCLPDIVRLDNFVGIQRPAPTPWLVE